MPRVSPSDLQRARRAAPYVAAAGSIAIVIANWSSSYCDVYLASQFFECEPVGAIDDLGHSLLAVAGVPIALTMSHSFLPAIAVWISRFGATVMAVLAIMYLLLAARFLDQTATVGPLLVAWSLIGMWLLAERGFSPNLAVFAIFLGVTAMAWALAFRAGLGNDAVRVAGGGLFVVGYPVLLAYACRAPSAPSHRRPGALVFALRLTGVAVLTLVAALPGLLFWFAATIGGPILGDPGYPLTVTNATSQTVVMADISASQGRTSLEPGATERFSGASAPYPIEKSSRRRPTERRSTAASSHPTSTCASGLV